MGPNNPIVSKILTNDPSLFQGIESSDQADTMQTRAGTICVEHTKASPSSQSHTPAWGQFSPFSKCQCSRKFRGVERT